MTHTLFPKGDEYRKERGYAWNGIPVRFISDEEMTDKHGRIYACWRNGVVKRTQRRVKGMKR